MRSLIWILLVGMCIELGLAQEKEGVSDQELKTIIAAFGRGHVPNKQKEQILASGARGTKLILETIETGYFRYGRGIQRAGHSPRKRLPPRREAYGNTYALVGLIGKMDVPLPVNRLCDMIERGWAPINQYGSSWWALGLLAASGHQRGLATLEFLLSKATTSCSPTDLKNVPKFQRLVAKWKTANAYVQSGKAKDKKKIHPATKRMRQQFLADPKCIVWAKTIDDAYLSKRFKACASTWDTFAPFDLQTFGRLYEDQLLDSLEKAVQGDGKDFKALFSGKLPWGRARSSNPKHQLRLTVDDIVGGMISDRALKIKLHLLKKEFPTYRSLLNHAGDKWLAQVGATEKTGPAATALIGYALLQRDLTDNEKKIAGILLTRKKLGMPEDHVALLCNLVKRIPKETAAALSRKPPHLSRPVLEAVVKEKLYASRDQVYRAVEAGIELDDASTFKAREIPADKLAKLSPAIRARIEAAMKRAKNAPARKNFKWIYLLAQVLPDDETITYLRTLSSKPGYKISCDNAINKIEKLQKKRR
jgi:hypothetical protein